MASASFTINSVSSPVEVAAGTPMTCTLSSVNGVRPGVAWSFIGKSDSDVAYPAITLSGTPYGSTASFTMPTPADLNAGFSLVLQCVINGGKDDNRQTVAGYTATGLCGVINARVLLPWAFGETTERGSIGIADDYNAQMATTGGAATTTAQINSQRVPWKATARFAITSNVASLSAFTVAASEGTAVAGNRLLLTGQTTASQNGLYVVGTVGGGTAPLTRASDMASSADCIAGSVVSVSEGSIWANTVWTLSTQGAITLGSTSLVFTPDRALTVTSLRLVKGVSDGQIVSPAVYAALKDNGGGDFYWNSSNNNTTRPDNGGTVIVPTSLVGGTGAWERQFHGHEVSVQWFGAKGDWNGSTGTNDAPAIQSAINFIFSIGGGVVLFPQGFGRRWRITSTLTVGDASTPVSRITLRGSQKPRSAGECQLVWDGSTGGGTIMLSLRQAETCFVEHLGFNANNKADYGVFIHHEAGDTNTCEKSGIRYCSFADARVYNLQIGKLDGSLPQDSVYGLSVDHCLFCRPTGAHTTAHVRLRSPNAVGNAFRQCAFEGDATYPAYHVSSDSGHWIFESCASVEAGTATFNLNGYAGAVPPGIQVYGWESQDARWADIDFTVSAAATQRPIVFAGVLQQDIGATAASNIDSITCGTAGGYGGIEIINCHWAHHVNFAVAAAGTYFDYRNMTFNPIAHGTLKGAGLTKNTGRWNDESGVVSEDIRGAKFWDSVTFETGANVAIDTTHTGWRVSQAIRSGTGTNAGAAIVVAPQPGQAQTGGAANNNGADLQLGTGVAGTGGGGAAGSPGKVSLFRGDPSSGGQKLLDVSDLAAAGTRTLVDAGSLALQVLAGGSTSILYGASNQTQLNAKSGAVLDLAVGSTDKVEIDANLNVNLSKTGALASNATDGFTHVPTCSGNPSGTPTSLTGVKPIVYDTANNILFLYNGAWKRIPTVLTGSTSLDFGSISANTTAELDIPVTGAVAGDAAHVTPTGAPESGLSWQCLAATDKVTLRLANVTTGAIDPGARTWRATVLKF